MSPAQSKEFQHTVMVVAILAAVGILVTGVALLWAAWWLWINFPEWTT